MKYENAKIEDLSPKLVAVVKDSFKQKKGVFLMGSTGSGKTHALYAIKRRLKTVGGNTSSVENWVELLFELKERFNTGGIKTVFDALSDKEVIFIDDIGAERQTEWSQEMLYLLVNRAYTSQRVMMIATNLDASEFQDKYGDRIFSRINEMCLVVNMGKEDRRYKK